MTTGVQEPPKPLTKADFASDQEVRWCPGCGDYAILNSFLQICPSLGIPREKLVIVSGIGCAARFPYYVNSYGVHGIHGRAPAIATGVKLSNPELMVWVVGGDGDMLSIGGNHLLHALRRNVDLKIVCINNRIYGLTKGQYSPTSEFGKKTKSTPLGSVDSPVNPLSLALAAEATFVARSVDIYQKHLQDVLLRAARHKGSVFVEVLQNCLIFNDGAFKDQTDKDIRDDKQISLEHGKPMIFGKDKDKGLRLKGTRLEVVSLKDGSVKVEDLMVHDEKAVSQVPAYLLSRLDDPQPLGVLRAVEKPVYDRMVQSQIAEARKARGNGDLAKLLRSGDTWEVKAGA